MEGNGFMWNSGDEFVSRQSRREWAGRMRPVNPNSRMYKLTVPGAPVAQPRHKVTRTGRVYIKKDHPIHAYKEAIKKEASQGIATPLEGAIKVAIEFYMPRPTAKTWKRKAMPPYWHEKKPDIDNLAKAVLDSLSGVAFKDDSQVSSLSCEKRVGKGTSEPVTIVTISTML